MNNAKWRCLLTAFLAVLSIGCQMKEEGNALYDDKPYFDMATYFDAQIDSLQRADPMVFKTVKIDQKEKAKTLHIPNWQNELGVFRSSDINKRDWETSFRVDSLKDEIRYTALDEDMRTKYIAIRKREGKISHIHIRNRDNNVLYQLHEELHYFPGKSYDIKKTQQVRLLGRKDYHIQVNLRP